MAKPSPKTISLLTDHGYMLVNTDRGLLVKEGCGRCGSGGIIPQYGHVYNGVCFECHGAKYLYRKPASVAARIKRRIKQAVEAEKRIAKMEAENQARAVSDGFHAVLMAYIERSRYASQQWVGSIGDTIVATVTIEALIPIEGYYGSSTLVKMIDDSNNSLTWFASSFVPFERGEHVTIKARVKDHDEYEGTKQTKLTRVRIA